MTPAKAPEHLFDVLYDEHRRAVHAYFLGKTGDTELALDLVQELFLRVWRSLAIVAAVPADRLKYWLFSAARNLVVDQYRARASREAAHLALSRERSETEAPPAEREAALREQVRQLDRAIGRLPEEQRIMLVMQVVGGRTSSEIGDLLGKPAGTVRYQISQARRTLAAELRVTEEP